MSEYTPTTKQVRDGFSYDPEAEFHDPITPHHVINRRAFDRWLTQHEAKVRDDYRDRLIDALRETKRDLDVTDPFHNGFVTGVDQLIQVLDSVKERANDSFATIYR